MHKCSSLIHRQYSAIFYIVSLITTGQTWYCKSKTQTCENTKKFCTYFTIHQSVNLVLTEAFIQIDHWSQIRYKLLRSRNGLDIFHHVVCGHWPRYLLAQSHNILATLLPCLDTSKYRTHSKCKTCSLRPFYKLNRSSFPRRYLITCVCLASIFIANYILMLRLGCQGQVRVQCSSLQQLCSVLFCSIKPLIGYPCKFGCCVFF